MIRFKREGTQVKIVVDSKVDGVDVSELEACLWDCPNEIIADILFQHLRNKLWKTIEKTRKHEYEEGWKDAKAKRRKEQYFRGVSED